MKAKGVLKKYQTIERKLPSEKDPNPPLFKMHIFAPDQIVAKSRFWYFLRHLRKFKKATGEIVLVKRILEKTPRPDHQGRIGEACKTRRAHIKQFHDLKIRFPLVQRYYQKRYRKLFSFRRPDTFYQ